MPGPEANSRSHETGPSTPVRVHAADNRRRQRTAGRVRDRANHQKWHGCRLGYFSHAMTLHVHGDRAPQIEQSALFGRQCDFPVAAQERSAVNLKTALAHQGRASVSPGGVGPDRAPAGQADGVCQNQIAGG